MTGAARERHKRAPGPVTASGMDCGSVSGQGSKNPPDRRRLLLFLLAGRHGSLGGRGVPTRRCLSAFPEGRGAPGPRAPGARGASRASALLLLVLVPSPRLAAAAQRRPLGDWERSRPETWAPPAIGGSGAARRGQLGPALGVAGAARPLHLCLARVPTLASSRRGRIGRWEERGLASRGWGSGAGRPEDPEVRSLEVIRFRLGLRDESVSGPALLVRSILVLAS